jgi:hypothetical protein
VTHKRCPACEETKPVSEFGRNQSLGDGLSFYCLSCNRARNNRWYRESRSRQGKVVRDHSWIPDGFRWCPDCKRAVAHEEYSRNAGTPSGFGSKCKACHNAGNNAAYWLRAYGMPRKGVDEIRAKQGNRCALCAEGDPGHLDHDHVNGSVRALLCQRCNFALGLLRDDPDLMRAAADYIEVHQARFAKAIATTRTTVAPEAADRPGTPPVGSDRRPGGRGTTSRSTGRTSRSRRQTQAGEADH